MRERVEFGYWSVSESNLDVHLYNILAPIDLGFDEQITWNEFEKKYPHTAYAWKVRDKFIPLMNVFEDIQMIQKLVTVSQFPIKCAYKGITRYEWLRVTLDLFSVK